MFAKHGDLTSNIVSSEKNLPLATCLGDFVPEEDFVLSLRTQFRFLFKLLFQLEDFVLGRILSQGGFYSKEFYPISYFI